MISYFLLALFDQVTGKPIASKTTAWKAAALATGLGIAMLANPTHAAPTSGGDTVQGLYDELLDTMKSGRSLGQSGRFARLEPVIRRTFDIPTMARLSVGSSWATLPEGSGSRSSKASGVTSQQSMPIVSTATLGRNCRSLENSRLLVASW